jgi:trimeric autotransporter adhesin
MKITITLSILVSFELCQLAQAVSPAPDGGYPGGNTAEGQAALFSLTTGVYNTAVGLFSLESNATDNFNTALGAGTLLANTADQNTATGAGALLSNTTGFDNTANGTFALFSNTIGGNNTAAGARALVNNTTGEFNTADGLEALLLNTTGIENTASGYQALVNNTTGFGNIGLGVFAGAGVSTANNVIAIGAGGANIDNSCFIGQIYFNVQPVVGTDPDYVTINSSGRLGRANLSSRRYKHDIRAMDRASEVIYALKPVSFCYNKEYDSTQTIAFGLIAEEVAEVAPDLVGRNREGQAESVRYEQINAMLLNEFLKEHRTVQELKKTIEALTATAKQQAAQIRKVSAQVEISKQTTKVTLSTP